MPNRNNVRITDEAHTFLAEKAEYLGATMKEVASEAILSLFKKELKYNEYIAQADRLKERLKGLQKKVYLFAFGMFVLGAVVAGCLGFLVGVIL